MEEPAPEKITEIDCATSVSFSRQRQQKLTAQSYVALQRSLSCCGIWSVFQRLRSTIHTAIFGFQAPIYPSLNITLTSLCNEIALILIINVHSQMGRGSWLGRETRVSQWAGCHFSFWSSFSDSISLILCSMRYWSSTRLDSCLIWEPSWIGLSEFKQSMNPHGKVMNLTRKSVFPASSQRWSKFPLFLAILGFQILRLQRHICNRNHLQQRGVHEVAALEKSCCADSVIIPHLTSLKIFSSCINSLS